MSRSHTLKATAIHVDEQIVHLTPAENHDRIFYEALGSLHVHWSNCESVLVIIIMLLSGVQRKSLDIFWCSQKNTSARIDLAWSLAKEHLKKKKLRNDIKAILQDFRGHTKVRNLYSHGQYIFDEHGGEIRMAKFYGRDLTPSADKTIKRTNKVCNKRMLDHIKGTIVQLGKINERMWDFAFILEKETGRKLEGLPQWLLLRKEKATSHPRQKKGK